MDAILEALKEQKVELEAIKSHLSAPLFLRGWELVLNIALPLLTAALAFALGWYFASPFCP